VLRSAAVPFGWIIGCPLLGWLSDRIGRRKPVIIGAALVLLLTLASGSSTARRVSSRPTRSALVAGIASGAAMIPYTVIKEANRPEHSGTATGVINFINFSLSRCSGRCSRNVRDFIQQNYSPTTATRASSPARRSGRSGSGRS
jgi:MFS family permease